MAKFENKRTESNRMGSLIVIEGLDGSGKATQAKLLAQKLAEQGTKVREVSFPNYDSPSSSLVKMYLAGEFGAKPSDVNAYAASCFYAVDRYASYKTEWAKDYAEGVIVADRYTTSNAIHQCSKLDRDQWDAYLEWLFRFEYEMLGIPEPAAVIYLRVDPTVSQKLMEERYHGEDKRDIHEKDIAYLVRCQEAAEYCAKKLGWQTVECIRDGQLRPVEAIRTEILSLVQTVL